MKDKINMKYEWRKTEKSFYLPKNKPERIFIPKFNFFSIKGACNPNSELFGDYIGVLYALSYGVKMSPKSGNAPENYFDYTIYPLEGIWDIKEEARANFNGIINKDDLVFNLMIRQPDFVNVDFANEIIEKTKKKKTNDLFDQVKFESIEEGDCIQMMHLGSYDDEPNSFKKMEDFAESINLKRISKIHREIYLSDARKTESNKLKTILRFSV